MQAALPYIDRYVLYLVRENALDVLALSTQSVSEDIERFGLEVFLRSEWRQTSSGIREPKAR